MYADFEVFQAELDETGLRNTDKWGVLTQHKCSGFSIVPVLDEHIDEDLEPSHFSGEDAMENFFDELEKIVD